MDDTGGVRSATLSASLAEAVIAVRRRCGAAALRLGGDSLVESAWSTGMPAVDGLTTARGVPRGRLTILVGKRESLSQARSGALPAHGTTGRLTLLQAMAAAASRDMQIAYVDLVGTLDPGFLADLGADLDACLVVRPEGGAGAVARGLVMARSLVAAGVPWLGMALGPPSWRDTATEHALAALAGAVEGQKAVACVSAPAPLPAALAYASSLTIACAALGWHQAYGDVAGLRVRLQVAKSKVGAPGGEASLLLRYPRPHALGEVVGLPSVVAEEGSLDVPRFGDAAARTPELPAAAG